MTDPIWCVLPVLAGPAMTEAAISDLLAQSVPTRLLIINQGVDDTFRDRLERLSEQDSRIFVWHHQPPLPSVSASWNLALDTIWQAGGGEVALVVNNDVRLHRDTVLVLQSELRRKQALFVSAVGVMQEDWKPGHPLSFSEDHGGPDFSCFLILRECHGRYRFDEHFVPAFCEDLDYHRRLMLAGEGKRIFSVNVPYLHLASQTLKQLPAPEAERIRGAIEHQSRAYYARKWGGPVNQERFAAPFLEDGGSCFNLGQVTTPELQRRVAAGLPPVGCAMHDDQPIDDCPICAREYAEYEESEHSTVLRDPEPEFETMGELADPGAEWADSNQQEELDGQARGGSPAERPTDPTASSD